jgi:hypothetical protein
MFAKTTRFVTRSAAAPWNRMWCGAHLLALTPVAFATACAPSARIENASMLHASNSGKFQDYCDLYSTQMHVYVVSHTVHREFQDDDAPFELRFGPGALSHEQQKDVVVRCDPNGEIWSRWGPTLIRCVGARAIGGRVGDMGTTENAYHPLVELYSWEQLIPEESQPQRPENTSASYPRPTSWTLRACRSGTCSHKATLKYAKDAGPHGSRGQRCRIPFTVLVPRDG